MLTFANFNVHAGVDGWGRRFDVVSVCASLDADVLVLQETWTDDDHGDKGGHAEQVAAALGYEAVACPLAVGRRARPDPAATGRWMPPGGFRATGSVVHVSSGRPFRPAVTQSRPYQEADSGSWGIAALTRRSLRAEGTKILHLSPLRRDWVHRAAIVVDLTVDGVALSVVGTHMSHLQYGSHRHYAELARRLRTDACPNGVLLGDMNLWGPPVRALLPGWHRAVKGRTWPAWSPHSQIDHILLRGPALVAVGEIMPPAGSDHRPVRARDPSAA